jgi:hypothetical protein
MGKTRSAYPPEFRRQLVELVRAGRSPEELARKFEPTAMRHALYAKCRELLPACRPSPTDRSSRSPCWVAAGPSGCSATGSRCSAHTSRLKRSLRQPANRFK